VSLSRRTALAAGLAVFARPAVADDARDAAPTAADAAAWGGYEQRLHARLADAGGGRFDEPTARTVLDLTNKARASPAPAPWPGTTNWRGRPGARRRPGQRAYVEHLTPEGFDPSHRLWLVGRTTIGSPSENIAYHRGGGAPATAASLMGLWRGHPDHWRNVLRPSHTHAAFGLVRRGDRSYLVGLYARRWPPCPRPCRSVRWGPTSAGRCAAWAAICVRAWACRRAAGWVRWRARRR
jgi:hypothetical protein